MGAIARQRIFRGMHGEVTASATRAFRPMLGDTALGDLEATVMRAEQSNTSVMYGHTFILKLFRRSVPGLNPDLEIGRYLTEKRAFPHIPAVAGALEYRRGSDEPVTLAILQGFVANEGDAWSYTLDLLSQYYERVQVQGADARAAPLPAAAPLALVDEEMPTVAYELIQHYLESARLLGQRTAELHLALAAEQSDPAFAPEAFTSMYQRSLYQTMRSQVGRVFQTLNRGFAGLPEAAQADARKVLEMESQLFGRFQSVMQARFSAMRTRCHGDYHLGQVLYTGNDFMIIDFEGEPAKSLAERRRKRSPLLDVAGMLRSFHYAAYTALFNEIDNGTIRPDAQPEMERWADFWYVWVSATFLKAYLDTSGDAVFMPKSRDETRVLLNAYQLDKAVYELGYEMNNRPTWVRIPLWGILQMMEQNSAE
jgi:maltose alpha-D-glucosyltransferase/alpha-amylase